jgi:hypothetical protein
MTWERLTQVVPYPFLVKLVGSTFAIDKVHFSAILLPEDKTVDPALEFLLWGLTMRITSNLLAVGKQKMPYRTYTTGSVMMDSSLRVFDIFYHQQYKKVEWENALKASALVGTGLGLLFYMNKARL